MRTLQKPSLGISAKELFELCASGFSDKSIVNNLLSFSSYVEKDSEAFKISFPDSIHQIAIDPILPNGITKDQIKKVYSEKFVAQKSSGRIYYDILISAPKGGKCPICGDRIIKNLDHYLPKKNYLTLVVTPENLIPTCRDCNFDKHTYTISSTEDAPLHPYFDNVSNEVWLAVTLLPNQSVLYNVDCPETWSDVLKARTKNHLLIYGLDEYYASKAAQEIADEIFNWKQVFIECGKDELLDHLQKRCVSIEKNEINSWKAALYRGIISQFSEFIRWLL